MKKTKATILFVDDNGSTPKRLISVFGSNYHLQFATSAKDGLKILELQPVHVVVSYQRMPGMTGVELLAFVKEKYPVIQRILLADQEDLNAIVRQSIKDELAQNYLLRSWGVDEFKIVIKQAAENYKLYDQNRALLQKNAALHKELKIRKEKEKKSTLEDEFFRNSFDHAAVGIAHVTPDGKFLRINRRFCDIVGYSKEEMLARTFQDITHPDDLEADLANVKKVLEGEQQTYSIKKRYIHKSGSEVWVNLTDSLVSDASGASKYFISVIEDMTEYMKVQEELHLKNNTLKSSPSGFALADLQGHITYVNPAFLKIWGYTDENEILGRFPGEFLERADRAEAINQTLKQEGKWSGEIMGQKKNGTIFPLQGDANLILDYTGSPVAMMISFMDLTKQKLLEKILREKEKQYSYLFSSIRDTIFVTDINRKIVDINPAFTSLFGYSLKEIQGKQTLCLYENKEQFSRLGDTLQKNNYNSDFQVIVNFKKKNGDIFPGDTSVNYLRDEENNTTGIIGIIKDVSKQEKTKADLTRNEEQYRTLVENIPGIVYRCKMDKNWTMEYVSDNIEVMTGYPAADFIGNEVRSFSSIIHPKDRDIVEKQILETAKRKSKKYKLEYRLLNNKGQVLWIREQGQIILDDRGKVDHLDGNILNITKEKKAFTDLEREKYLFNTFLNNISDNIYFKDLDSQFTRVNKAMAEYLGLKDPKKILGKTDFDFFSEEHAKQVRDDEKQIIKSGITIKKDEKETWPDGRINWVSTVKLPRVNNENEIIGTMGISRDITDVKLTQLELYESEEKFRLLFDNMNEGFALHKMIYNDNGDPYDYLFLDMNPRFEELTGLKIDETRDRSVREVIPGIEKDPVDWIGKYGQVAKTGKEIVFENYSEPIKKYFRVHSFSHRKDHFAVTISDITENIVIQERLIKAKESALQANRAKSEFLANMSHEIRTPMNAVLGYTELLTPLVQEKIQKDYLHLIRSSGNSLLTLINDILDLAKIEAGKLELSLDFIEKQIFFSEMEQIFSYKIAEKGIGFFLEISSGTPASLYIDELRLRQVVVNLLGNAIKFTQKGYVKLSVWTENPQVINDRQGNAEEFIDLVIEVEDTGIGISRESQEKIFDAFQQQEETNVKVYGGTGLGLAITKRLVELMNGSITVISKLGKGSTFKVIIPDVAYLRDFESHVNEVFVDSQSVIFEESTVLVVDDVEHNRKFLADALSTTNLKLLEAENGEVAINLAKEIIPDLIISDIRMPIMDSFELLDRIKKDNKLKHIPVLAYSASAMKVQKVKIMNSEFAGLLIKPVKLTELYLELINHLPHQMSEPEHVVKDVESLDEEFPEAVLKKMPELIKILESDLYKTWETFSSRQPMNEVRDFGERLIELGKKHKTTILSDYGKELITATQIFDVKAIQRLLGKYPELLKQFRKF